MADWGAGGEGAMKGAATGAMVGSVAGPYGAAIGAGVGGVYGGLKGLFGSDGKVDPKNAQWADRGYLGGQLRGGASDAAMVDYRLSTGRATDPTQLGAAAQLGRIALGNAAQLDPSQQAEVRALQMAQANRLGQISMGQAAGAGELAVQRQAAQAAAQQQAAARMNRGLSAASAQRGAARNLGAMATNTAGQAQIAALQDAANANAQLGGLYDSMRGADLGLAGQNAQLSQQAMLQQGSMDQQRSLQQGQFDQERMMQQGALNQQTTLANADRYAQAVQFDQNSRLAYLAQLANMNQSELAARMGREQAQMSQPGLTGPLLAAGGQVLAAYAANRGGAGGSAPAGYQPYGNNTVDPFRGY